MDSGKATASLAIGESERRRSAVAALALSALPFLYGCYKLHMVGWAPAEYPFTYLPIAGSAAAMASVASRMSMNHRRVSSCRMLVRGLPFGLAAYMIGFLGGYELWLSIPASNGQGIAKGTGWLLLGCAALFHLRRIRDR